MAPRSMRNIGEHQLWKDQTTDASSTSVNDRADPKVLEILILGYGVANPGGHKPHCNSRAGAGRQSGMSGMRDWGMKNLQRLV